MTGKDDICKCPRDPECCRRLLLQAHRQGSLETHCIMEGLSRNRPQCRTVLLESLTCGSSNRMDPQQRQELREAGKQTLLTGYSRGIRTVAEIFYEVHHRLVRSVIHKTGIKEDGDPSVDDVSQQVFADLHEHFGKGASVRGRLSTYVARATVHECYRQLREATRHGRSTEQPVEIEASASTAVLPSTVVERWKDMDEQLVRAGQGDLLNRIILGQRCAEGAATGQHLSAKDLLADWKRLSQTSTAHLRNLHAKAAREVRGSSVGHPVEIAAHMINTGAAACYQMTMAFAAAEGMDLEQTKQLVASMADPAPQPPLRTHQPDVQGPGEPPGTDTPMNEFCRPLTLIGVDK